MKVLVWLSGNDPAELAHCPNKERMKCAATGALVAVVSLLATISGTATTHAFLRLPLVLAIAAGLYWGTAIMMLDRWFLLWIRRQRSTRATLAIASPRILVAIVSAMVIGAPVVLAVFHTEINARARTERQAAYAAAWQRLERHFADVPNLEDQAEGIEDEMTSVQTGSAALADPEYQRIDREASKLEAEAGEWSRKATCEADGSCGSHHVGEGPRYKEKHGKAVHLEHDAEAARSKLSHIGEELKRREESGQAHLNGYRNQRLDELQAHLARRLKERKEAERELNRAYAGPIGLLDRIEALASLSLEHPFMGAGAFLVALLIALIDASPALGKTAVSIGLPTLLERTEDAIEADALDALKAWRAARQQAHEIEASIVVEKATLNRELERETLKAEVAVRREFREEYMREFAERVRELTPKLIADALRDYNPNGVQTNGGGPTRVRSHNQALDGDPESRSERRNFRPWPRRGRRAA